MENLIQETSGNVIVDVDVVVVMVVFVVNSPLIFLKHKTNLWTILIIRSNVVLDVIFYFDVIFLLLLLGSSIFSYYFY